MFRDDITGALATSGTSSAYTLTTNQNFNPSGSGALTDGLIVAFRPHVTNASPATLNVDSTSATPLRLKTGTDMPAGSLEANAPYMAYYNLSNAEWLIIGALSLTGQIDAEITAALTGPSGAIYTALAAGQAVAIAASGAPLVIVEEQKASGTNAGTFTSGSRQTRALNTLVRNVGTLASLASNQVTLPAGTYYAKWSAPGSACRSHQSFLRNVTDSADIAAGTSEFATDGNGGDVAGAQSRSEGSAVFTLAAPKALSIQHQCFTTVANFGLGGNTGYGAVEVYSRLEIWKLA